MQHKMTSPIKIIIQKITSQELSSFLGQPFEEMVKFVIDVEKGIIALGGELHSDAEQILLEAGSKQENLWGANIYPNKSDKERLEYASLINIRPSQNNFGLEITDKSLWQKIKNTVDKLLPQL